MSAPGDVAVDQLLKVGPVPVPLVLEAIPNRTMRAPPETEVIEAALSDDTWAPTEIVPVASIGVVLSTPLYATMAAAAPGLSPPADVPSANV